MENTVLDYATELVLKELGCTVKILKILPQSNLAQRD